MAAWWPFGKKSVEVIESKSASVAASLLNAKHEAQKTGKDEILLDEAYDRQLAAADKLRTAIMQQKSAAAALRKRTKQLEDHEQILTQTIASKLDPKRSDSVYRPLLVGLKSRALQMAKKELGLISPQALNEMMKNADNMVQAASKVITNILQSVQPLEQEALADAKEFETVQANSAQIHNIMSNELTPSTIAAEHVLAKAKDNFDAAMKEINSSKKIILDARDRAERIAKEFADRFKRETLALRPATLKLKNLKEQLARFQAAPAKGTQRMRDQQLAKITSEIQKVQEEINKINARVQAAAES